MNILFSRLLAWFNKLFKYEKVNKIDESYSLAYMKD